MESMSTDFVADSSSRFAFRARTNRTTDRQTGKIDATERPTHAGGYIAGLGNNAIMSTGSNSNKSWQRFPSVVLQTI